MSLFNRNLFRRVCAICALIASTTLLPGCRSLPPNAAKGYPWPKQSSTASLVLQIRCTDEVVRVGDEISIEFLITNKGIHNYSCEDYTSPNQARKPPYRLTAKTESGTLVPSPSEEYGFFSGNRLFAAGFSYQGCRPGGGFTQIIPLNSWALVREPGRYTIVGIYADSVTSAPITITVLPRSEAEMQAYIKDLTNAIEPHIGTQVSSIPAPPPPGLGQARAEKEELNRLVAKLTYTGSPQVVPFLLRTMNASGAGSHCDDSYWEIEGITHQIPHTKETTQAIIEAAMKPRIGGKLAPCNSIICLLAEYGDIREEITPLIEQLLAPDQPQAWSEGVLLARVYSSGTFTTRLIAIANTPHCKSADRAMSALAANRTDEGVEALKALLNSSDHDISHNAEMAIREAYVSGNIYSGHPLKPSDFPKKHQHRK